VDKNIRQNISSRVGFTLSKLIEKYFGSLFGLKEGNGSFSGNFYLGGSEREKG